VSKRIGSLFLTLLLALLWSACDLVGGIFKAGFGVGILIAVVVLIVLVMIFKGRGRDGTP
jgi:hypothetical protein